MSENDGKQLQRQVYVANRVKTVNEKIYYNVDKIHNAISANKQISFLYFKTVVNFGSEQKIVNVVRRDGKPYIVSPWALCWDDENYYMIAYDEEAQILKHYRVGMPYIEKYINVSTMSLGYFEKFDIAGYSKSVFSMFGGEEADVTLSVDNSLVGVIADRFGSDVFITRESDSTFWVSVKVMLSPQFYAWVFGLGNKVRIISPESVVRDYKTKIADVLAKYEER